MNTEGQYCFQDKGHPRTLTMTLNGEWIIDTILNPPIYIWLGQKPPLQFQKKMQQIVKQEIVYLKNQKDEVEYLTKYQSNSWQVKKIYSPMRKAQHSNLSSADTSQVKSNPNNQLLSGQGKRLQIILEQLRKWQNNKYMEKILPNFFIVSRHQATSNKALKCLSAMISQETNEVELSKKLMELVRMFGEKAQKYKANSEQQKKFLSIFKKEGEFKQIFKAYTEANFLHRIINNIFRVGTHPSHYYLVQPFVKQIFAEIKKLYKEQKKQNFICFRGGYMAEQQLKAIKENVGFFLQNLGFLSASMNPSTAEYFCKNVMIVIQVGHKNAEDFGFADIQSYSQFQSEQQILFNPLNIFQIISVQPIEEDQRIIMKITLKYGKSQSCSHFLANQRQLLSNYRYFGKLMQDFDNSYQGSFQFWKKYKELAEKNQQSGPIDIIIAEESFGILCSRQEKFEKALEHYQNALKLFSNNKERKYQIKRAAILSHIGTIKYRQLKYNEALTSFQQCSYIEIELKENSQLAISFHNIGNVYSKMGKFDEALRQYQESLSLKKEGSLSWAKTAHSIGILLHKAGRHIQAKQMFEKSLKIKQQICGKNSKQYKVTENYRNMLN